MAHDVAAEALLEAIDAPQFAVRQIVDIHRQAIRRHRRAVPVVEAVGQLAQIIGDAPQIVAGCAAFLGPADRRPLQRMVGHAVALAIAARSPEVPGRLAIGKDHNRSQRFDPDIRRSERRHDRARTGRMRPCSRPDCGQ